MSAVKEAVIFIVPPPEDTRRDATSVRVWQSEALRTCRDLARVLRPGSILKLHSAERSDGWIAPWVGIVPGRRRS